MKKLYICLPVIAVVLFVFSVSTSMAQAEKPAAKPVAAEKAAKSGLSGKLNINTATAEQIDMLPGLGMARAQAIIDYRNTNGNFKKIEDLQNVKGIKEKKTEKFKDYIIFEGETTLKKL